MRTLHTLAFTFLLFSALAQTSLPAVGNITAGEIAARLAENNLKRRHQLQSYTGRREYHLLYTGFPGRKEADMVVDVKYEAPNNKDFTVVSQSGSRFVANHVFKKLLDTEKEAAEEKNQAETAMSEQNYKFELLGKDEVDGRPAYVMNVEPRISNKLLYRGKIWVDATDFAVARIEAEPAKRPSMWISKTVVHHLYHKVGDFWLPIENESTTDVRLGGRATLSIHYGDYKVVARSKAPESRVSEQEKKQPSLIGDYEPLFQEITLK